MPLKAVRRFAVAAVSLLFALVATPFQAGASPTVSTLELISKPFDAGSGYSGEFVAIRNLSATNVSAVIVLASHITGTTANSQDEDVRQSHAFSFDWDRRLTAMPNLSQGRVNSGTQMKDLGGIHMRINSVGPRNTRKSCGGRYARTIRPVVLHGTFTFSPDAPVQPFFGTLTFDSLKGKLVLIADRTGQGGCGSAPESPCPTGMALAYLDGIRSYILAAATITQGSTTQFMVEAILLESRGPADVYHFLLITTPDTSPFTAASDLSSAHLDSAPLDVSAFQGATGYTSDGNAAQTQDEQCADGTNQQEQTTHGSLSDAITVTFDGYGSVSNTPATDAPPDQVTSLGSVSNVAAAMGSGSASPGRSSLGVARRLLEEVAAQ